MELEREAVTVMTHTISLTLYITRQFDMRNLYMKFHVFPCVSS